jgi:CheY-like chemotaxis protein
MTSRVLAGKRVLVAEDELLVAMLVEDILADNDCLVLGPFASVSQALEAAKADCIDVAVLDVNLCGQRIYPVAEVLADRGIPFLFLSGYGKDAIPPNHPEWRACKKPFTANDLTIMLIEQLKDIE